MKKSIYYLVMLLTLFSQQLDGQSESTKINESWKSEVGNQVQIKADDNGKNTGIEIRGNKQFAYLDLTADTSIWSDHQGRLISTMWGDLALVYRGRNLVFQAEGENDQGQLAVISKSVFDHAGRLGIGTETPSQELHVYRDDENNADLRLQNKSGGVFDIFSGSRSCGLFSYGTKPMLFATQNTERMRIDKDGRVGIGLPAPNGYKLAVGGKMIAEELKVKLSSKWPDYVFQADYKLPTLEEVEQHIQTKGHLPNIPSADELEKADGFEVSKMANLQQEKIEEIFLYLIELRREIEALKEDKQQLEKEIELLKHK